MIRIIIATFLMATLPMTAAENLALGKDVIYSVSPDNPKDNSPSKLTDGRKHAPIDEFDKKDAKNSSTFDEQRTNYESADTMDNALTVGWHSNAYGMEIPGIAICIDLKKINTVSSVILRAGSFTQSMYRFSLPRNYTVVASMDGKQFYRAGSIRKITSDGLRKSVDSEKILKVRENSNFWMNIEFELGDIEARYIGLIVQPEGFMFYLDEFEVYGDAALKPNAANNQKLYQQNNQIPFAIGNNLSPQNDVVFGPFYPETFYVPNNIVVPAYLQLNDFTRTKQNNYKFFIELPKSVELLNSYLLTQQFEVKKEDIDQEFHCYILTPLNNPRFGRYTGKILREGKYLGPLYFKSNSAIADGKEAKFYAEKNGVKYEPLVGKIKTLEFQLTDNNLPGFFAITWMSDFYSSDWPDFVQNYKKLGFNAVPVFPRYWEGLAKLPGLNFNAEEKVKSFRDANLQIIQNESPFHTIKGLNKESACTYTGATGFCPSYRGEFYKEHLNFMGAMAAIAQPEILINDIELMHKSIGGSPQNLLKCDRCAAGIKNSNLSPEEYLRTKGAELQKELYDNVQKHINKKAKIGQYDLYAGQKSYQKMWSFAAYPEYLQLSMPAAYSAGLYNQNHNIAQREYRLLKQNWVSATWVTPGCYGYVAPHKLEAMVYEQILNGGNLNIYSLEEFNSPIQLFFINRAIKKLNSFKELFDSGKPDGYFKDKNQEISASKFENDSEALILLANYASPEVESVEMNLPSSAKVISASEYAQNKDGKWLLPPAEFVLLHITK